jgi:hypothetical protein
VLGLARAAAAAGDTEAARRRYRELLTNFDQADADLPVLMEARAALERPATPTSVFPFRATVLVSVAIVCLAGATLLFRAKKRGPVSRASQKTAATRRRSKRT